MSTALLFICVFFILVLVTPTCFIPLHIIVSKLLLVIYFAHTHCSTYLELIHYNILRVFILVKSPVDFYLLLFNCNVRPVIDGDVSNSPNTYS